MRYWIKKRFVTLLLLVPVALQAAAFSEAAAKAAPFSLDSIWFFRDGARVVPEIGRRWLTVVFNRRYLSKEGDFQPTGEESENFIRKKAAAMVKSSDRLVDYLYDPHIAENACFLRMREGQKPEDVVRLMNQLGQDGAVQYVHPTLVLDDKHFAFFNAFEIEWKTGISKGQRESLLNSVHAAPDEKAEKENRCLVDVAATPFFRAINLLAEDIRVLRVTPYLVEIKPSIRARLALPMSGGNIGDSMPFTLTIIFSDRVNVDPSSIAAINLRPPELQKELFDCVFDPYDYAKAVEKSPIVITGRVRFFASGEFTIPPVRISYSCPSCSNGAYAAVRSIETRPVLFKVASMIPAQQSENRLIVTTDPVPPDFPLAALHRRTRKYLWLAVACFLGLVPCAAWMFFLSRRAGVEREKSRERRRNGRMAEQLRALLHTAPEAPHWVHLGEVGALLRDYLAALYQIDVKYSGGSCGQFMETISAHLTGENFDSLGYILAVIDNAVALESEHYQDIEGFRHKILELLDSLDRNGAAQG